MPAVHFRDELLDIETLALTRLERTDAFVNVGPEATKCFDVRQELSPDFFLRSER
jgi:hypothetical protein